MSIALDSADPAAARSVDPNVILDPSALAVAPYDEQDTGDDVIVVELPPLEHPPISPSEVFLKLEWKDVRYKVPLFKGGVAGLVQKTKAKRRAHGEVPTHKELLKGLSGSVRPGEMLAIMGSSGAGKTTLLDVLAGRIKGSNVSGQITINGENPKKFSRSCAYVQQDDALFPLMTVTESLTYSAKLRLPSSWTNKQRRERVEEVIDTLGLRKVAKMRVGSESVRGVSGGERRRVSIGMELVVSPSILFLDEPTSGLDSFSAFNVITTLHQLAKSGRTIIFTIHQPSSTLYKTFDRVMFLSEGQIVYNAAASLAPAYFSRIGLPAPEHSNPADHILETTNLCQAAGKLPELVDAWKTHESEFFKGDDGEVSDTSSSFSPLTKSEDVSHKRPGLLKQTWILAIRDIRNIWRTPALFIARLVMVIVFGILMGTLYLRAGEKHSLNESRQVGAFFVATVAHLIFPSLGAIAFLWEFKMIFKRERASKYFKIFPYFLAQNVAQILFFVFLALLFPCITYFLIDLDETPLKFFYFCTVVFLTLFLAWSFVIFMSVFSSNLGAASAITATGFMIMFMFSGFFITRDNIPKPWIWMYFISFFNYPLSSLLVNEYHELDSPSYIFPPGCDRLVVNATANITSSIPPCAFRSTEMPRRVFGVHPQPRYSYLLILIAYILFFRLAYYLVLRFRMKGTRK